MHLVKCLRALWTTLKYSNRIRPDKRDVFLNSVFVAVGTVQKSRGLI